MTARQRPRAQHMIAVLVSQQNRRELARAQASVAEVALDRALGQAAIDQQRGVFGLNEQRIAAATGGQGGDANSHIHPALCAAASAPRRSSIISPASSMPIESRTKPAPMPRSARCSG